MNHLFQIIGCVVIGFIAYHLLVDEDRPEYLSGGEFHEANVGIVLRVGDCRFVRSVRRGEGVQGEVR